MTDDDQPSLLGQIKAKLIRSKEDWAREGRRSPAVPISAM
jgi:hypothetical protein